MKWEFGFQVFGPESTERLVEACGGRTACGYNRAKAGAMAREYMEERNGGYYVAGTGVSLDSVVPGFADGLSP